MAAAAAPPHLAGHHCITITPLSATHQQRQHHRNSTVPSPFTLCTIVPAPFPTTASSRSTIFSPPHLQRASATPPQLRRANLRSAHVFYHHRSSAAPPSRRHFLLPVSVQPLHAQLPSSPLHLQRARHHHLHTRTAAVPPPRIAHSHDNRSFTTIFEQEPRRNPSSPEKKHLAGAAASSQGREKSVRVKP